MRKGEMPTYDVKCPRCAALAVAEMRADGVTGTYREAFVRFAARRVACGRCGLVRASDTAVPYELWFRVAVRGHTAWARNRAHAAFLADFLSHRISNRDVDPSAVEALPGWMLKAKNRVVVVRKLRQLIDAVGPGDLTNAV